MATIARSLVALVWLSVCAPWVAGCNTRGNNRNPRSDQVQRQTQSDQAIRENDPPLACSPALKAKVRDLIREEAENHDILKCENVTLYGLFVGTRFGGCLRYKDDSSWYSLRTSHLRCLHSAGEIFVESSYRIYIQEDDQNRLHLEPVIFDIWERRGIEDGDVEDVKTMCQSCMRDALKYFEQRHVLH